MPQTPQTEKCFVCAAENVTPQLHSGGGTYSVECPRCGCYEIGNLALLSRMPPDIDANRHLFSGALRNFWEQTGVPFRFLEPTIRSWETLLRALPVMVPKDTDIPSKADAILRHLRKRTTFPGKVVTLNGEKDVSVGYCRNTTEFRYCLSYLVQRSFAEYISMPGVVGWDYRIAPEGWFYLAGGGSETLEQGFIAMSFKPEFNNLWHSGIETGIERAGYKPFRIDDKQHNNRIDDEIIAEIRKSRFLVADLTGQNAGAYFEAGFAMGLGRPVIWTCEQREIDEKKVHFDTRQYSIVSWMQGEWEDFARRLTLRIEATIGRGRYHKEAALGDK